MRFGVDWRNRLVILVSLVTALACSVPNGVQVSTPTPQLATSQTPTAASQTPLAPTRTPNVEGLEQVYNGSFIRGLEGWRIVRYNDGDVPQFEVKNNSLSVTWLGGTGVSGVTQEIWFGDTSINRRCFISLQVTDRIYSDIFSTGVVVASTPEQYDPAVPQQAVFKHYGFGFIQQQVSVPKHQRTTHLFIGFDKTADDEWFTVELFSLSFKCKEF